MTVDPQTVDSSGSKGYMGWGQGEVRTDCVHMYF